MFQYDPSLIPSIRTRKALLIIDPQNDFASPSGAPPVTESDGYVARILNVAAAFRTSGNYVIWVRSEYDVPRPVVNDNILTSDTLHVPSMQSSTSRLRRLSVYKSEEDDEAFLSGGGSSSSSKPACVRPGTYGAELVREADVDPAHDSSLVKTDYSAFASDLLPLLRSRLAVELYLCGPLTNVGIHATVLATAPHGFTTTLIEDCCGRRSVARHTNAVRNLKELTGCKTTTTREMLTLLGGRGRVVAAGRGDAAVELGL